MGVYIKGMEMPTSEEKCKFFQPAPFRAPFCVINGVCHGINYCPLVPVPPHGDLVDRGQMREIAISLLDKAATDQEANAIREMWSHLGQMPVYIPAEEGET